MTWQYSFSATRLWTFVRSSPWGYGDVGSDDRFSCLHSHRPNSAVVSMWRLRSRNQLLEVKTTERWHYAKVRNRKRYSKSRQLVATATTGDIAKVVRNSAGDRRPDSMG